LEGSGASKEVGKDVRDSNEGNDEAVQPQQNISDAPTDDGKNVEPDATIDAPLADDPVMNDAIEHGDFIMINSGHFGVVLARESDGGFRSLFKTTDERVTQLVEKASHLPCIGLDPALTRQIYADVDSGSRLPEDLALRVQQYWREPLYLPEVLVDAAEYVAFRETGLNDYTLGILADNNDVQASCFTVKNGFMTLERTNVSPGSAVFGPKEALCEAVLDIDFLDYCLLNVIQTLSMARDRPGYVAVAIQVDTRKLAADVSELQAAQWKSIQDLGEVKDIAASTRRGMQGEGLLGAILVTGFLAAEMAQESSLTAPYVEKLRSIEGVVEFKEKLLADLRRQAEWIEDDVRTTLTNCGVNVIERGRIREILAERQRTLSDLSQARQYRDLLTATHLLIVELGQARSGGTYHLTATLVDCKTGQAVWSSHRDRESIPKSSTLSVADRFVMNTGRLAILTRKDREGPAELVHVEQEDQSEGEITYREVLQQIPVRVSRKTVANLRPVNRDSDVPSPLVPQYVAWRIAEATMPIASAVTVRSENSATITSGEQNGLRLGEQLHVFRIATADAGQATRQQLPLTASVSKLGPHSAEVTMDSVGVSYLWAQDYAFDVGDLVLPVNRRLPIVASRSIEYKEPNYVVLQALGIDKEVEYAYTRDRLYKTILDTSHDVKQRLCAAGVPIIEASAGQTSYGRQYRDTRGATHVVSGQVTFSTTSRQVYEVTMELHPVQQESEKTIVRVKVRNER
jgi:hypothetical protein